MKKLIFILSSFLILNTSCEEEIIERIFTVRNSTGETSEFQLYRDTFRTTFILGPGVQTRLDFLPSSYDSVKIYNDTSLLYEFDKNNACDIVVNMLCENNYKILHEGVSKDGSSFILYQLEIY